MGAFPIHNLNLAFILYISKSCLLISIHDSEYFYILVIS